MDLNKLLFYYPECLARETRRKWYQRVKVPKLFRYAQKLEFAKIQERCVTHPRQARREAAFQDDFAPHETPLHACLYPFFLAQVHIENDDDALLSALLEERHNAAAALLQAHPDATLKPCVLGTVPLHLVAMDPCVCIETVDMLCKSCPRSALLQDLEGRTALHYACINNRGNFQLIEKLVQASPEATTSSDKLGRRALHYACGADPRHADHGTHTDLAHGFNEALVQQARGGGLLSTRPVLELLLQANQSGTLVVDHQGRTPVHYLCQYLQESQPTNEKGMLTVEVLNMLCLLVQINPKVVKIDDPILGVTPLAVLEQLQEKLVSAEANNEKQDWKQHQEALQRTLSLC